MPTWRWTESLLAVKLRREMEQSFAPAERIAPQ